MIKIVAAELNLTKNRPNFNIISVTTNNPLGTNSLPLLSSDIFLNRQYQRGISIDGQICPDIDDLIWIEKDGLGHVAHISISDVAAVVAQGSEYDIDPLRIAFTKYRKTHIDHMFPANLAEFVLPLLEGQKRLTLTYSIPLGSNFSSGPAVITKSWVQNEARLYYSEVPDIFGNVKHPQHEALKNLASAAEALRNKRTTRGSIALIDQNKGVAIDEDGKRLKVTKTELLGQSIVQEFMIAANIAVAEFCLQNSIPTLFRNHRAGKNLDRNEFVDILRDFPSNGETGSFKSYLGSHNIKLGRSNYGTVNEGHFALGVNAYTHATSPIRRAADVIVQRGLHAFLDKSPIPYDYPILETTAQNLNSLQRGRRKRRSSYFRQHAAVFSQERVLPEDLSKVGQRQFPSVIRFLIKQKTHLPESALQEITKRLAEDRLNFKEIALLLCSQETSKNWQLVKEAAAGCFVTINDPVSVLNQIQQKKGGKGAVFKLDSVGPLNKLTWTARANIKYQYIEYRTPHYTASSKNNAQQLAALDLLRQISGLEATDLSSQIKEVMTNANNRSIKKFEPIQPSDWLLDANLYEKVKESELGLDVANSKGTLIDLCRLHNLMPPIYESLPALGPDGRLVHRIAANMSFYGETISSDIALGTTIKNAEKVAAVRILALLEKRLEAESVPTESYSEKIRDAKTELNNYCAIHKLRPPKFKSNLSGPAHKRIFETYAFVNYRGTILRSEAGYALKKRDAEKSAAANLLTVLKRTDLNALGSTE